VKIVEDQHQCRIMIFGLANMNFGLGDINSYSPDYVYVHL
jgi:hypothetical protein